MRSRAGTGWQYVMTDLSLILFMITATALREAPTDRSAAPSRGALPALGEPVAVWRGRAGGPSLGRWLAGQGGDPHLRLTVVAPLAAAPEALALARQAGRPARLVLEPGGQGAPYAALTYDAGVARGLHAGSLKQLNPEQSR